MHWPSNGSMWNCYNYDLLAHEWAVHSLILGLRGLVLWMPCFCRFLASPCSLDRIALHCDHCMHDRGLPNKDYTQTVLMSRLCIAIHLTTSCFNASRTKTKATSNLWAINKANKLKHCCRNWPRFCVRGRGWTRHHARVGSPVAPRAARSRATPRVRGGASNHGSWRKNVVNFHSTKIIEVVAFKPLNRVTRSWIGITSIKSTPPSSESTLLCTRDDVTMVHECKQSTNMSHIHVKKNFQVNTFHDDFKAWMDFYSHCVCLWSFLKYTFSFYKVKLWQSNRGIPVMLSNLHNYPWVVLLQRTAFQWWRHGNRSFLLAEKGIPKLRTATSR